MKKLLNIEEWNRKETYEYFKDFENPYVSICVNVDITNLYQLCKRKGYSINLMLHHKCLLSANSIREFKIRYAGKEPVEFEHIDGGATILLEDKSIRFCLYEFSPNFDEFVMMALASEKMVRQTLTSDSRTPATNVIHFSAVPWTSFTSITHPLDKATRCGIPKITFGKIFDDNSSKLLPISIDVDHSLMDGYHIWELIKGLQDE